MARPLRIEYPGAVYHITSRGNAGNDIFLCDEDRIFFLDLFAEVVKRYNWICHSYCLMGNHYHLLIETADGNLSLGMRHLNGVYTQKHNWRHGKTGHVFQGRYKAIIVDKDSYLLELCRYVVLNPVRAGMVIKQGEWKWSSYRATAGFRSAPWFLSTDFILSLFSENRAEAQILYRKFVRQGIKAGSPWSEVKGQVFLGRQGFIDKQKEYLSDREKVKEIPRLQRYLNRPELSELFPENSGRDERNQAIFAAHVNHGYKMNEIASYLGVHYTTISKAMNGQK